MCRMHTMREDVYKRQVESCYDKLEYNPDLGEVKKWDFSRYTPQVVVVAIGQNDNHPVDYMAADPEGSAAEHWRKRYREMCIRDSHGTWRSLSHSHARFPPAESAPSSVKNGTRGFPDVSSVQYLLYNGAYDRSLCLHSDVQTLCRPPQTYPRRTRLCRPPHPFPLPDRRCSQHPTQNPLGTFL